MCEYASFLRHLLSKKTNINIEVDKTKITNHFDIN